MAETSQHLPFLLWGRKRSIALFIQCKKNPKNLGMVLDRVFCSSGMVCPERLLFPQGTKEDVPCA